jgi:NADH-quinone oxidoreductase subunit N
MNLAVFQPEDLFRIAPELVLCGFGILIMLLDPFLAPARKRVLGWTAFLAVLIALAAVRWAAAPRQGYAYGRVFIVDSFSLFLHVVVLLASALVILGSIDYLDREHLPHGEFYALILFATAGMGVLCGATELVTAFIGLEMSSISSYILAGYLRNSERSSEASLKYFLLGSFATAFFLYGIAMVYGATGTTQIMDIRAFFINGSISPLIIIGLGMMFVGLGFKVVAAPFQIYAPDVYEGAPTPVSALLSSAPKVAAFAIMIRVLLVAFGHLSHIWFWVFWISALLSMCIGNFAALLQTNIKRMLAYSSIAHAGYILVAFAASSIFGVAAILFYLAAYIFMKVGAFSIATHVGGIGERRVEIADYAGLGREQPAIAACFTLFLLSLLGLPATAGFLGKFYVFQAALNSQIIWLVVIAALNSVVGSFYYLRVIVTMYFKDSPSASAAAANVDPYASHATDAGKSDASVQPDVHTALSAATALALLAAAAGTIYLGILPSRVMAHAIAAAASLR